jgi:hypothetical protein
MLYSLPHGCGVFAFSNSRVLSQDRRTNGGGRLVAQNVLAAVIFARRYWNIFLRSVLSKRALTNWLAAALVL